MPESLDLKALFDPPPILSTKRLVLRALDASDAEGMFAYHRDPFVCEFVHFHPAASIDVTNSVIAHIMRDREAWKDFVFAVTLKESGEFIGTIDVHTIEPMHQRLELGWMMTRAYWGHGYMTEAVRETIRFCFDILLVHRIEASISVGNVSSERLAERAGMIREGTLRENENEKGRFVSNIIYAITRTH